MVLLESGPDHPHSWHGNSNNRGSSNGHGLPSHGYRSSAGAAMVAANPPRHCAAGAPGSSSRGSTADVVRQQHWRSELAAAKNRPEAAEGWQLLGVALQGEREINLSRQGLTDRDLEAIARYAAPLWSRVTSVDLSHNSITGLGMVVPLAQYAARHWR